MLQKDLIKEFGMELLSESQIKALLVPLANGACGENCEYDELYLKLDELATGTPSSQMGDSVIEGKDPDYRTLYSNCLELFNKTLDLRVASFFTLAALNLEGLTGLKKGLMIIEYLVKEQFISFYPLLDPDDDNDPTERINILSMLAPDTGAYADSYNFLAQLRAVKLVEELPYSYRDYLVCSGFLESADKELDSNIFNAQMSAVPISTMQTHLTLVQDILSLIISITTSFNEQATDLGYLTMETLEHELGQLKSFYLSYLKNADAQGLAEKDETNSDHSNPNNDRQEAIQDLKPTVFDLKTFEPRNRNEALEMLKKSASYFAYAEPTSPVPYLINRALRMANMNFIDLLGEIDQNALERGKEQLGILRNDDEQSSF